MTEANHFVAGDIEITTLMLRSRDGCREVDIRPQVQRIHIYEDVLHPAIFAEFEILDSINLLNGFPIIGEEYIELVFTTPGGDSKVNSFLLYLNKITDRQINENNRSMQYKLQCVSYELFTNAVNLVYDTFEQEVSKTVKSIFTDYLKSAKKLRIEETKGVNRFTLSAMHPMVVIDWCRRRAISQESQSSSYVFFENTNGYYFCTLEYLFKINNQLGVGDRVFFFDRSNNIDSTAITIRNIIAHNQVQYGDTLTRLQYGGLKNLVLKVNTETAEVTQVNYGEGLGAAFETAEEDGLPPNSATFVNENTQTTGAVSLLLVNADTDDESAERQANMRAYITRLMSNMIQIHIYGDSSITIGDVIQCNFPEVSGLETEVRTNIFTSGKYMITAIRHIIQLGDRANHTMACELVKGNILG